MKNIHLPQKSSIYAQYWFNIAFGNHGYVDNRYNIEDVEFEDITDIQEEEPGEEAYCVPI